MSHQSRRSFLKTVLAGAATITIAGTKSSGKVLGANDTIRVGVAGIRNRGKNLITAFAGMKGVQVTYLIDPDTRLFAPQVKRIQQMAGNVPQTVQDIRKVLEDKNVDAIGIATPNHWHALMTIWACQAGKDVYVEKPGTHNIHEGRIAVDIARKQKRIVQHGTGIRSGPRFAKLAAILKTGKLGKVLLSYGSGSKPRTGIGFKPVVPIPPQVDFDLWLGPAAKRDFHENLVHYNWHWFWEFGNGDVGNQGIHQLDIARWLIPGATLPKSVISVGGRFAWGDQGETPNTQLSVFDFDGTQLIFEMRNLQKGKQITNYVVTEAGAITPGQGGYQLREKGKPAVPLPDFGAKAVQGAGGDHFGNFIAAVRSRKHTDLNADILEGHYSCTLAHMANISYRLGKEVPFNGGAKVFGDNKEANEKWASIETHLAADGKLKLAGEKYQLGAKLDFDAKTERFKNNEQANKLVTREYRKPFVVPEKA